MAEIIKPGRGILYMKVGLHAQESLEDIIARKRKEIDRTGYAMWGYGGSTCHPRNTVQPFARDFQQRGEPIYLCMEEMNSQNSAAQVRADEWSIDRQKWEKIPPEIAVLGSQYALVIKDLRSEEFHLSLQDTKVSLGNCMGRPGSKYLKGRVDKACLEITNHADSGSEDRSVKISLVAELVDPFAVFLRNNPSDKAC